MIQIINADFQRFQSILQKLSVCFDVRKQNWRQEVQLKKKDQLLNQIISGEECKRQDGETHRDSQSPDNYEHFRERSLRRGRW